MKLKKNKSIWKHRLKTCQISKGVDDFLEVTIVDKGNKDEKQQIGRCQAGICPFFHFETFSIQVFFLLYHFEILYSRGSILTQAISFQDLNRLDTVGQGKDSQLMAET